MRKNNINMTNIKHNFKLNNILSSQNDKFLIKVSHTNAVIRSVCKLQELDYSRQEKIQFNYEKFATSNKENAFCSLYLI